MVDDAATAAGEMWGSPSKDYDDISFSVSDALMHAAMRLNAQQDEQILDIATGTGMSARNAARSGAFVTAIDIADGLLTAAEELSHHVEPPIKFMNSDAGNLPFANATFDRAISTFGIMFAPDQQMAASELARVLKPGSRAVLACWAPDPAVTRVFALIAEYDDAPPAEGPDPMQWGTPAGVTALLGDNFDLQLEDGVSFGYFDDRRQMWEFYARTFGPVRQLIGRLDHSRVSELRERFEQEHLQFQKEAGIRIPRPYLLTKAIKK